VGAQHVAENGEPFVDVPAPEELVGGAPSQVERFVGVGAGGGRQIGMGGLSSSTCVGEGVGESGLEGACIFR